MALRCFLCVDSEHEDEASLEHHLASHHSVEPRSALLRLGRQRRRELVAEIQEAATFATRNETWENILDDDTAAVSTSTPTSDMGPYTKVWSNPMLMEEILRHLDPRDIKTVALVCRSWRHAVERPRFWAWATVYLDNNFFMESEDFGRRLKNISRARINLPITSVTEKILSKVIVKMSEVFLFDKDDIMRNSEMNDEEQYLGHLEEIFTFIGQSDKLVLRKLNLEYLDQIQTVSKATLCQALCRIESVDLLETSLSPLQARELFISIAENPEIKLRKLCGWQNGVTGFDEERIVRCISPETFARAAIRLEEVNVSYKASEDQLDRLFTEIATSIKCRLRKIDLVSTDLTKISPNIFSTAIIRLEEVYLGDADLTRKQVKAVFTAIVEAKDLRLKTFHFSADPTSYVMSRVKPKVLSEASKRVFIDLTEI